MDSRIEYWAAQRRVELQRVARLAERQQRAVNARQESRWRRIGRQRAIRAQVLAEKILEAVGAV